MVSCEKDVEQKKVMYLVTDSVQGFSVSFTGPDGAKQPAQNVAMASEEDEWTYTFMTDPGSVVYLSVTDTLPDSFVKVMIFIDGKVYKQASRDDIPEKPVTVSGTVPFDK